MSLMCGSQDLTLQAILSNGVATVRQTLRRMFSAMAAERAKKRRKLVQTPGYNSHRVSGASLRGTSAAAIGRANGPFISSIGYTSSSDNCPSLQ